MFVVRPITIHDFDAMQAFGTATSLGIANLPRDPERLHRLIENGCRSFGANVHKPGTEVYPFILENALTGERLGTCTLLAHAGWQSPYCCYYLETDPDTEKAPPEGSKHVLLYPKNHGNGNSELCALYLSPNSRKSGIGKLLALSRLLFIAAHPKRFTYSLFADMRGYINENNECPFWDNLGAKLWNCSYKEILKRLDKGEVTLEQLMPRYPIHLSLLPEELQHSIGKTHPNTQAAYHMLTKQGLTFQREVSILDGGPIISSPLCTIDAIINSKLLTIGKVKNHTAAEVGRLALLANERIDFRCCLSYLELDSNSDVSIDITTLTALHLDEGDHVRVYYI